MALILIVDDRPIDRQLLTTLLGYKGYRLREAGDGAEALAAARTEPPDLIITDLLMPTMDGFELVRHLRADPVLAATPVIFYTARYHRWESRELEQISNVRRLDKPSEPEAILSAVEQVLAASASASSAPLTEKFDREHLRLVTDKLARSTDQLEYNHLRLVELSDLGRLLIQEHDLSIVLEQCCRGARRLFAAKYAIVVMLEDDRHTIRHLHTSGLDKEAVARINRPEIDLGPLCRLLDDERPLRLRHDSAGLAATGLLPGDSDPRSLLFVPASRHTALILVEKLGAEEFSAEDEQFAITLASLLDLSCENVKLRNVIRLIEKTEGARKR